MHSAKTIGSAPAPAHGCGAFYIVVPCYNEQEVLPRSVERLCRVSTQVSETTGCKVALVLVDDGSGDGTWPLIRSLSGRMPCVVGLRLSRNRGHQQALWAGLEWAADHGAQAVVSIDADLQDPPEAIAEMARLWHHAQADVVYGVRRHRTTDTWLKRTTAQAFYRMMRAMGADVVYNHADFRLLSRRALLALLSYEERNLFLRGLVRELGFNEAQVSYDRAPREAGESKYPLRRMLAFALDGITSFSVKPLRLITLTGLCSLLVAVGIILYALVQHFCGHTLAGWTSLLVSLWLIGGALLLSLGVVGEYVGKIYAEVKRRPRYFVMEQAGGELPPSGE